MLMRVYILHLIVKTSFEQRIGVKPEILLLYYITIERYKMNETSFAHFQLYTTSFVHF